MPIGTTDQGAEVVIEIDAIEIRHDAAAKRRKING